MDRKRRRFPVRELMGFILLAVLLLGGILSSFWLSRHHQALARKMEEAAWYAVSQDWDRAKQTTAEVSEDWQRRWKLCAVFSDHTPMIEIDTQLAQLSIYAAAKDHVQFAAVCGALARNLQSMAQAQHLSWWNLL